MPWSMEPVDLRPTFLEALTDRPAVVACAVDLEAEGGAALPDARAVQVRLFPRDGGPARAAILGRVTLRRDAPAEGAREYVLDFAAAPPGRYQLVMSWTDARGLPHHHPIAWPGAADGLVTVR